MRSPQVVTLQGNPYFASVVVGQADICVEDGMSLLQEITGCLKK